MCTISWFVDDGSYSVFFNRDESKQRARALPPAIYRNQNQQHIMPIDPDGGGSWLAVNASGLTFALLNYYQGRLPKGRLRSRGEIVKELVSCRQSEDVDTWFQNQNMQKFAPFSLLVFSPEIAQQQIPSPGVPLYRWNGKQLTHEEKTSPHFSSAIDFEHVCEVRKDVYQQFIHDKNPVSSEDFLQFHRSHYPEKSRQSICMHREDASTVSFSHVSVTKTEISFYYTDGPPCEAPLQKPITLNRPKN